MHRFEYSLSSWGVIHLCFYSGTRMRPECWDVDVVRLVRYSTASRQGNVGHIGAAIFVSEVDVMVLGRGRGRLVSIIIVARGNKM